MAAGDLKIPSEIKLNLAKAYAAYQSGNASAKPAAAVQLNNQLAQAIMNISPTVHNKDTALLIAQQMTKGDMSRSSFKENFGTYMAILGTPGDISAMGEALADGLGLKDAPTLETIQAQEADAVRQREIQKIIDRGPDAVFDEVRRQSPNATYEQVQARVLEMTGQESGRPNWEVTEDSLTITEEAEAGGQAPAVTVDTTDPTTGRNFSRGSGDTATDGTLGNLGRRR
jgi:hypothetical protein